MKNAFMPILFFALMNLAVPTGASADEYELSNVKAGVSQTGSIADMSQCRDFYLGASELERSEEFERSAVASLEAKGYRRVEHGAEQVAFLYFLLSDIVKDSSAPWIKESYKEGEVVLYIVLGATDKETNDSQYKDINSRIWSARISAAVTPPLILGDDEEKGMKVLITLYKKLFAQLVEQCIPEAKRA